MWLAGIIAASVIAIVPWQVKHGVVSQGSSASPTTVAVLPFRNMNGDSSVDYLRFASADEIATVLTYTRSLDHRPSSATRKYVSPDLDPQQAGRELHVANDMTGHFLREEDSLLVTLEAIDANSNRLRWQTDMSAPSHDFIA